LNRCDDMLVIHRLIKHPELKFKTLIGVEKVKDQETGGKHTEIEQPVKCEFNNGLGFVINGIDPLATFRPKEIQKQIENEILTTSEKLRRLANETPF
jgi:hypothetical protein